MHEYAIEILRNHKKMAKDFRQLKVAEQLQSTIEKLQADDRVIIEKGKPSICDEVEEEAPLINPDKITKESK